MEPSTWWWLLAGVLVAVELTTGTFYLLMLAMGAAAGALAAHLGLALTPQVAVAAVVGGALAGGWHLKHRSQRPPPGDQPLGALQDADLALDLGQTVQVDLWQADGTTRVSYRGTEWTARLAQPGAQPAMPGRFRIQAMKGNLLLLVPDTP